MSWFDKLFGESKENTEDIRTERLDTSENDVYRRPRGKFRFPVDVDTVKTKDSNHHKTSNTKIEKMMTPLSLYKHSINIKRLRLMKHMLRDDREELLVTNIPAIRLKPHH